MVLMKNCQHYRLQSNKISHDFSMKCNKSKIFSNGHLFQVIFLQTMQWLILHSFKGVERNMLDRIFELSSHLFIVNVITDKIKTLIKLTKQVTQHAKLNIAIELHECIRNCYELVIYNYFSIFILCRTLNILIWIQ